LQCLFLQEQHLSFVSLFSVLHNSPTVVSQLCLGCPNNCKLNFQKKTTFVKFGPSFIFLMHMHIQLMANVSQNHWINVCAAVLGSAETMQDTKFVAKIVWNSSNLFFGDKTPARKTEFILVPLLTMPVK